MAVPAEIRAVPRPKNTVVENNGRPGPKQYVVRERSGAKYVPHGNSQPHNGRVIGHIVDMVFVPVKDKTASSGAPMLSYGASAFVKSVVADICADLLAVFDVKEAYCLMAVASLRILRPRLSIRRYSTEYARTFVSRHYPGIPLSSNTITSLLTRVGQDLNKRREFFVRRMKAVCEQHHIAIDGSLIQDTSRVNDLSAYSRKARIKGCKDVSLLYAYDIELGEPICAQVYPGNCIDACAYRNFIATNHIEKGIIVADKGFPVSQIESELIAKPQLHYLTPLRRNDARIVKHDMLRFETVVPGIDKHVLCKKISLKSGRFLYAFKDVGRSAAEEKDYLKRAKAKDDFDSGEYFSKKDSFGTIVFESDLDLPERVVYGCYADRWMLELVFRQYKNIEGLDSTNVQGDFAVIGSEFVNFISTLATCRMVRIAEKKGLLEDQSFGDLMHDLGTAWRETDAPNPPSSDDGYWVHTTKREFEVLEALGLSMPPAKPEPKRVGRPRIRPEFVGPKRPRGRPRKVKDITDATQD